MYPVDLSTGQAGERSRGLGWAGVIFFFKGFLLIPHFIILWALGALANVVAYVGFFVVAFTGELPQGLRDILVAVMRWQARVWGWFGALTDEYPPFVWDDVEYPIRVTVDDPPGPRRCRDLLYQILAGASSLHRSVAPLHPRVFRSVVRFHPDRVYGEELGGNP